jgi:hypothetical protein
MRIVGRVGAPWVAAGVVALVLAADGSASASHGAQPRAARAPETTDKAPAPSRPERQWEFIRKATDDGCRERLAATGATFHPLPDRERPNAQGCGIPRGVILRKGPTGVRYSPAVRIDCSLALELERIETLLKEEVERRFDAELVRLGTLGSYACRGVVGKLRGMSGGISEHSFGNAIDVTHFDLSSGRRISVLRHYPRDRASATSAEGHFLRSIVRRTWRELDLRALGPDFDPSHRDHLHFDAGSRWSYGVAM